MVQLVLNKVPDLLQYGTEIGISDTGEYLDAQ